jgi:hypothetical protein
MERDRGGPLSTPLASSGPYREHAFLNRVNGPGVDPRDHGGQVGLAPNTSSKVAFLDLSPKRRVGHSNSCRWPRFKTAEGSGIVCKCR